MTRGLTPDEHRRVTEAIRAAEARSSGEIYCVVARASDGYFFPAAAIALASILAGSLVAALLIEALWLTMHLSWFAAAQLLAAACACLVLSLSPPLRIALVPHRIRQARAHDNAVKQFLARNVHVTAERTGVLMFVSLAEHYAEIVADSGIDHKVPPGTWDSVVAALAEAARADRLGDGFVAAVAAVGALLAEHFPLRPHDRNELDDHVVEI